MTEELHELFKYLRDHRCVLAADITTEDGDTFSLSWENGKFVVTETKRYCIA